MTDGSERRAPAVPPGATTTLPMADAGPVRDEPGPQAGGPTTLPIVATMPIVAQPLRTAPVSHRATQMSASAIPSTLESPKDALVLTAQVETRIDVVRDTSLPMTVDDDA